MYVDSSVIMGMTGDYNPESVGFDGMEYMPCSPANGFFPDLAKARRGRRENIKCFCVLVRLLSAITCQLLRAAMSLLSNYANFGGGIHPASESAKTVFDTCFLTSVLIFRVHFNRSIMFQYFQYNKVCLAFVA